MIEARISAEMDRRDNDRVTQQILEIIHEGLKIPMLTQHQQAINLQKATDGSGLCKHRRDLLGRWWAYVPLVAGSPSLEMGEMCVCFPASLFSLQVFRITAEEFQMDFHIIEDATKILDT